MDPKFPKDPFGEKICQIISEWSRGRDYFTFHTSGTTGGPKNIRIHRDRMQASAEATLDYLDLSGGTSLLCLNPEFIAGTMMIVRSIVGEMNLVAVSPTSDPMAQIPVDLTIDLCAMVPLQVSTILENRTSMQRMKNIKNILIGGADLDRRLMHTLTDFPNPIYQTFGMTETVSHIALKRINGRNPDESFHILPGNRIERDQRGCMIVTGMVTGNEAVVTNDLIELIDTNRFRWLGRYDHVINTGGVKILIEDLEQKIKLMLERLDMELSFFIVSIPDEKLGEKIGMVIETQEIPEKFNRLKDEMKSALSKYEMPREFRKIPEFIRTPSDKIDRRKSAGKAVSF